MTVGDVVAGVNNGCDYNYKSWFSYMIIIKIIKKHRGCGAFCFVLFIYLFIYFIAVNDVGAILFLCAVAIYSLADFVQTGIARQ